jgi:hypothetical protein
MITASDETPREWRCTSTQANSLWRPEDGPRGYLLQHTLGYLGEVFSLE